MRLMRTLGQPNPSIVAFQDATPGVRHYPFAVLGYQRLPDEPTGSTTVTFKGVQAGTELHVYDTALNELTGVELSTEDPALTWPTYPVGNPANEVIVTIIKRGFKFQRFTYTSEVGAQVLQIFPLPDLGYNNPA